MAMTSLELIHHWLKENYEDYSTILICEIAGHHNCHIGQLARRLDNIRIHRPFIEISEGYTDHKTSEAGVKMANICIGAINRRVVISDFVSELLGSEEHRYIVWNHGTTKSLSINDPKFFNDLKNMLDKRL
jgi:hypothetical protein